MELQLNKIMSHNNNVTFTIMTSQNDKENLRKCS